MKKLVITIILLLNILMTGCLKKLEEDLDVSDFRDNRDDVKTVNVEVDDSKGLNIVGNEERIIQNKVAIQSQDESKDSNTKQESKDITKDNFVKDRKDNVLLCENMDTYTLKYKKLKKEYSGRVLDTNELDKENNDKYSWWLRLNSNHELSGIDPHAEGIINDYDIIYAGDNNQKKIYLTFDEGYENGYTPMILDTLKENDVSAIFFVTGSYLRRNPELVRRMLEEGHKVGSHSVNHPSFPDIAAKDYDRLEREMLNLEQEFYDQFGIGFSYIRPPRGEYSERTLKAAMQLGYKNVFWSYAYKDYDVNDQRGTEYAYNKVMDHLHNGMVVLLHAVSKDNANMLDKLIKDIKSNGYKIEPFDL